MNVIVTGGRYTNNLGEFEVLSMSGDRIRVRYADGQEREHDLATQERIQRNRREGVAVAPARPVTGAAPVTRRTGARRTGTKVTTVPWASYSDRAQQVALATRAMLKMAFADRYRENTGSDSMISGTRTITAVKIVPLDANLAAVSHLGNGVLLGYRQEIYDLLDQAGKVPESLRHQDGPYLFGGARLEPFYVRAIPNLDTLDRCRDDLLRFVRTLCYDIPPDENT